METVLCPKCGAQNAANAHTCAGCGLVFAKYDDAAMRRDQLMQAQRSGDWSAIKRSDIPAHLHGAAAAALPISTTPFLPGRELIKALDLVSGESALGMNLLRDVAAGLTDILGGQSGSTQSVLRAARVQATAQLRAEAFAIGADGVVGVSIAVSEFSGGGKSMLFVVATGTAVLLR